MKVITARIEDAYFEDLKRIEKEEERERAEVMRKLLANAIKGWKMKKAMELLRGHKITLRKAAEDAGVSYVEMLDQASQEGIASGYTLKELQKDAGR